MWRSTASASRFGAAILTNPTDDGRVALPHPCQTLSIEIKPPRDQVQACTRRQIKVGKQGEGVLLSQRIWSWHTEQRRHRPRIETNQRLAKSRVCLMIHLGLIGIVPFFGSNFSSFRCLLVLVIWPRYCGCLRAPCDIFDNFRGPLVHQVNFCRIVGICRVLARRQKGVLKSETYRDRIVSRTGKAAGRQLRWE